MNYICDQVHCVKLLKFYFIYGSPQTLWGKWAHIFHICRYFKDSILSLNRSIWCATISLLEVDHVKGHTPLRICKVPLSRSTLVRTCGKCLPPQEYTDGPFAMLILDNRTTALRQSSGSRLLYLKINQGKYFVTWFNLSQPMLR